MHSVFCFVATLLLAGAQGLEVTNCTQIQIPASGARAATATGAFALFAIESHSDAPAAGRVDVFNADAGSWTRSQMSAGRTNIATTSWKHLAIFAGGTANRGQPKSSAVDVWDSTTGKWQLLHMSIGRDLLGCGSSGNFTLFAGGSAPQVNQSETDVVDIWDHSTDKWTVAHLSQKRKKPVAVGVEGKLIIAGGEVGHHPPAANGYSSTVDIFDTTTRQWTVGTLAAERQYFGGAMATPNLALFGGGFANYDSGLLGGGYRSNLVDIFDASANKWSTAKLSANRSNLDAANVAGRYVAFGSGNIDATAKITYDFFDGQTGEWAPSHGHLPGNPAVTSIGNVAMFANGDGSIDVIALNAKCPSNWIA